MERGFQIYGYRFIILLVMIPILATTNIYWLTFAPITGIAADFYQVKDLHIAYFSMSYMIVYILMTLPASWVVDTYGYKVAVAIGALFTGVFGLVRGIFVDHFAIALMAQVFIAIGQPFLTNSITKVAATWFPINERATASGILTMAGYVGMVIGLAVTPLLTEIYGLAALLKIYGYVGILSCVIFIVFAKAQPPTPPCLPDEEVDYPFTLKGLKKLLVQRDFVFLLVCVFIVMGIFNAVMTWIENILTPRGLTSGQAGLVGGILVIVGLVGAIVLPIISDGLKTRKRMLFWSLIGALPGFIGLTLLTGYVGLLISAGIMGFFLMGVGPIAFQYGAEIAYPIPEGTSFGILMLMGQISGILFTYFMDAMRSETTGSMMGAMLVLAGLMILSVLLTIGLKESPLLAKEKRREESSIES